MSYFPPYSHKKNRIEVKLNLHIGDKNKDIVIFSKGPMQGLDDSLLTAQAK